ncbi:hypothetical protein Adt_41779 [Abeliophyllum distichum]|uniref:Uncharacterized protein n=1 Tax=Abeliophyllum distichum TaxID=126358 RepID=A0ABD1PPT4_9LAMI
MLAALSGMRPRLLAPRFLEHARQKKATEEISREVVCEEPGKANETKASEDEVPLVKKRNVGAQDRPRPKLQDLAGSGSSAKNEPSDPKRMMFSATCLSFRRPFPSHLLGRSCWMPHFPDLSQLGRLIEMRFRIQTRS